MQLHSLHPSWTAPWRRERLQSPPESQAVRNLVCSAIQSVKARRMRESDSTAEEAQLQEDQRFFEALVLKHGPSEATRRRRVQLPPGMRMVALYANACRPPREQHALEKLSPLVQPQHPGGMATLGGAPFSLPDAYYSSRLPHVTKRGAVAAAVKAFAVPDALGGVRVKLNLSVLEYGERTGFVDASQLILERRMQLAVATPQVAPSVMWDVCADAEEDARRIEIAQGAGVRYESGWYHPFDTSERSFGHFSCQSHDMKTSGHLLAGMAGKKGEEVLGMHTNLLAAARTCAERDCKHVPLVSALLKTVATPTQARCSPYPHPSPSPPRPSTSLQVDMHSQAVFGNLFSTRPLLDELRSRGQWREWIVLYILHLRWRAWDQREISQVERIRCIEVLSPLLDANLVGGAMFRPGFDSKARREAGLLVGVRAAFFSGFSWQTVSARLAGAAMHCHAREQLVRLGCKYYADWFVQRTTMQNDVEGEFGHASNGSATKPSIMYMGPRLDAMDVTGAIKNDIEFRQHAQVVGSKRAAYDPVDPIANKKQLFAWPSGHGNLPTAPISERWEYYQRKRAIAAAAGKQQNVRDDNTIRSRKIQDGAAEVKRARIGG